MGEKGEGSGGEGEGSGGKGEGSGNGVPPCPPPHIYLFDETEVKQVCVGPNSNCRQLYYKKKKKDL